MIQLQGRPTHLFTEKPKTTKPTNEPANKTKDCQGEEIILSLNIKQEAPEELKKYIKVKC